MLKARAFASAAHTAIENRNAEAYGKSVEFNYMTPSLTLEEANFYRSNFSDFKGFIVLDTAIKEATKVPYSLFPLDHFTEDQKVTLLTHKLPDGKSQMYVVNLAK